MRVGELSCRWTVSIPFFLRVLTWGRFNCNPIEWSPLFWDAIFILMTLFYTEEKAQYSRTYNQNHAEITRYIGMLM